MARVSWRRRGDERNVMMEGVAERVYFYETT